MVYKVDQVSSASNQVAHYAELETALNNVEGWLGLDDAIFLYEEAIRARGPIIEIGAFRGRSTIALALGGRKSGSLVYSIDPHTDFEGIFGGHFGPMDREAYYRNILNAGVAENAALVNLPSTQVANSWRIEIALLFIDGDHRYEAVRQDMLSWSIFLRRGGLIVFDDANQIGSGPNKVYEEVISSGLYSQVCAAGKLRAAIKI